MLIKFLLYFVFTCFSKISKFIEILCFAQIPRFSNVALKSTHMYIGTIWET